MILSNTIGTYTSCLLKSYFDYAYLFPSGTLEIVIFEEENKLLIMAIK